MIGKLIANTNNDKGSGALRNSLQNNDQKKVGASSKVFQSLLKVLKGDISTKEGQLLTVAPSTKGEDTVQEAGNDTILDKEKLATLHSHNIIKDEKHLSQDEGSDFLRQQLLGQSLAGNELLENDGQKQTGTAKINSAAEPKKTEQVQGKLGEAAVHNLAVEKEPAEKASSKPTTVEMKKESGKPLREIPHKMVNNSSRGENKGKPESGVSHTVSLSLIHI